MSNKIIPTLGIEIHLELNTKTKMFSSAPNTYNAEPNTAASLIDVAYPGTLPTVNKAAVQKAVSLAHALNMKIDNLLRFDRKNYYYTDIPKNYQITQQFHPIGKDGYLITRNNFKVEFERIHLEEDTAKQIHDGEVTKLDYNRAGIPLIEIVTKPIFHSAEDVVDYLYELSLIARYLNISDAKMEEGSFRVDVNISLSNSEKMGTKVEIKNLNSLKNVKKAIENEIEEQTNNIENNIAVIQSTKRFDEATQKNVVMRVKMGEVDYKYFPDPNIPPIKLSEEFLKDKHELLPSMVREVLNKNKIDNEYWEQLIENRDYYNYISSNLSNELVKLFFSEVVPIINKGKNINEIRLNSEGLNKIISAIKAGKISGKQAKEIIIKSINGDDLDKMLSSESGSQISDEGELGVIIRNVIEQNNDFIKSNLERLDRVEKFVMGQVMKATKGKANPKLTNSLVVKSIKELGGSN